MNLNNVTRLVKRLLIEFPQTRNNDYLLWLKVIERWAEINGVPKYADNTPISLFLKEAKLSGVPCFESVSRVRRKIQEEHAELRATPEVEEARAELEATYREYARFRAI